MAMRLGDVFRDRSVLVTGQTGFKGSWLCLWLTALGARVSGYSNHVPTRPSAFDLMRLADGLDDRRGDIADAETVLATMRQVRPSVVFHLAAQPIVREGFRNPYATFSANVLGTVAVLEAARKTPGVEAVVVVTSDKVYDNSGSVWGFRESDGLGGHEPYGASKAAAEIVAMTYRSPGFHRAAGSENQPALTTARAGNVIGGGDWAADRLIPDLVRAIAEGRDQTIRQPRSTRPWQHVLEPLGGYLCLATALLENPDAVPASINFGPSEAVMPDVETVARSFLDVMQGRTRLLIDEDKSGGEARVLRVDSSLAQSALGWKPCWNAPAAITETAGWYKAYLDGGSDMRHVSLAQLDRYREATPIERLWS